MSHKVAVKVLGRIIILNNIMGAEEFICKLSCLVLAGGFSSSPLGLSHRAYHKMASSRTNDKRQTDREKEKEKN